MAELLDAAPPSAPPARRALAEGLRTANRAYGNPAADRLSDRLADPATRVVVAGQQAGLLGGPLYTLAKMVATARWAAALEAAGAPSVAVFWVATEDHDYREVASATVLAPDGPRSFDLGDDPAPLTPVGARTLGPGIEALLAGIRAAVPGGRYAAWLDRLAGWYRPDARFGEAFCKLMADLLGERCPLLLDAMHPVVKAAERPLLARLVERREAVAAAEAAAAGRIEGRGYPLQVAAQPGASPLFLLHRGERRRVEWRDGGYRLRGGEETGSAAGSVADLAAIVADNPAVVSAGVLARPAVQDAILGTSLQVLGPGELSYMAQAAALYPVLEVAPPRVTLRPQLLVVESHLVDQIAGLGISLAELLGDRAGLDHRLAGRDGADLLSAAGASRRRLAALLDEMAGPAVAADPDLERPWRKTREQIEGALDRFADKRVAAAARADEVRTGRVERLRGTLLPGGRPQERVVSTAHFPGKYGEEFVEALWEQMELDGGALQVVTP